MKDTTIRVDRKTLAIAAKLAERFGVTQRTVLEQSVAEFHARYIAAKTMPLIAREAAPDADDEQKHESSATGAPLPKDGATKYKISHK